MYCWLVLFCSSLHNSTGRLLDFIYGASVKQQCSIALCSFWRHSTPICGEAQRNPDRLLLPHLFSFYIETLVNLCMMQKILGLNLMASEVMDVNRLEIFLFWKVKSCFKYISFGFVYLLCDLNFNLNIFCTMLYVFLF